MGDAAAGMQAPRNMYKRAFSSIKQTTRTHTQALFPCGSVDDGSFLRFKKFYTYSRAALRCVGGLCSGPSTQNPARSVTGSILHLYITKHFSPCQGRSPFPQQIFFLEKGGSLPSFPPKKAVKKLFIQPGPIPPSKPHFCPDLYSRYILRRRIRRAGVSPYSASRYASGEPYSCRRVSSTNWAASG